MDNRGDTDSEPEQATFVKGMAIQSTGLLRSAFLAPWDGRQNSKGEYIGPALVSTATFVALVLEFVFSFVLGVAVVSARFFTRVGPTSANALQDGFCIGLVHGTIWLVAWIWATDYNLKHYLNWSFLVGQMWPRLRKVGGKRVWVGASYGLLAFVLLGGAQIGGAATAGAFIRAIGTANIPNTAFASLATPAGSAITAAQGPAALMDMTSFTPGLIWFFEFLGVFLIVLANIYNDERHQDKNNNAGDARENEFTNHVRTGLLTTGVIVLVTAILYPFGSYTFGPVPYFAGLVAIGVDTVSASVPAGSVAGDSPLTPLIDYAHYLFTPIAAGAAGGLLAFIVSALLDWHPYEVYVGEKNKIRIVGNRTTWRSAKTHLLQRQQRPSHLAPQTHNSAFRPQTIRQRSGFE